jgi:hypothetical protein
MIFKKGLVQSAVAGATLAAGLALATPSQAVITTFASYSAVNTGSNIYWKNNGTTATNGTGGSLYTIGSGSSTTPGTTKIDFSFLQPALASQVGNVIADFTLLGSVTNSPALTSGGFKIQPLISGSFSILSTSAITVNGTTYAAGANLLSGTFDQTTIFGATNATSGSASSATTSGGTITYSSELPQVRLHGGAGLLAVADVDRTAAFECRRARSAELCRGQHGQLLDRSRAGDSVGARGSDLGDVHLGLRPDGRIAPPPSPGTRNGLSLFGLGARSSLITSSAEAPSASSSNDQARGQKERAPDVDPAPFSFEAICVVEPYWRARNVTPITRGSLGVARISPELPAWIVTFWM